MKMYSATIEAITMDKTGDHFIKTETQVYVPAESRGDAILTACDMGQAMARSTNTISGIALYFRVTNVSETNQGIA